MNHSKRLEIFENVRASYYGFLTSVLWKLTGDRELFSEALQYALLGIWQHLEKLNDKRSGSYIYRIALSANSKAWRNRIGKDGQINTSQLSFEDKFREKTDDDEISDSIRKIISQLPKKQCKAIVMRYLEQRDYDDIAEKLGCSQTGARSLVSKAIAVLKDKLQFYKCEDY